MFRDDPVKFAIEGPQLRRRLLGLALAPRAAQE
jgi:hypothetical protein